MTIHVRNWEKFQHADVAKNKLRAPAWIRLYTELHDDPKFLALTPPQRALLFGIWIEYAKTRREIPVNTAWLSRKLAMRVTESMLQILQDSGFITGYVKTASAPRGDRVVTSKGQRETVVRTQPPLNHGAEEEFPHDSLTTTARPEERRQEKTVRRDVVEDVAALDVEALNVVDLDSRRPGAEVNGGPLGPILDGLLQKRAQPP